MRIFFSLSLVIFSGIASAAQQPNQTTFFQSLLKLEFEGAKKIAATEKDSALRSEMLQLTDILYYEGQIDKTRFNLKSEIDDDVDALSVIRELNSGYISLFYDQTKGNAFKHFYEAYQKANLIKDSPLIKTSLLALLKYFNFEIAQNSDAYLQYLDHFERLQTDTIDQVWTTVYKMIFHSKSLNELDSYYFKLAETINTHEAHIEADSPVLAYIFFEKALSLEIQSKLKEAEIYYKKTIAATANYPFLKSHKFFALIKLMTHEVGKNDFLALS
jgi:hypothetical protein